MSRAPKRTSYLGICFTLGGLAAIGLVAWDPEYEEGGPIEGTIIANIVQEGGLHNPEEQVRVLLPEGFVVNAIVSPSGGHPYAVGTPVKVVPYHSLLFSKRTYRAYARGQVGP